MLGRRAHRELVHVRLAEDHRAGRAEPLGDVGVIRGAVAVEDPRARGALAAGQRHEVLERDRDPEQWAEQVERGVIRARGNQTGVGGIGLAERALAIDGQPDVESVVVAFGGREVCLCQLARRDLAGPQERRHLVCQEPRGIGHRESTLVEDGRDDDEVSVGRLRVGEDRLDRQRWPDDVVAQDVLELDRLSGRRDVVRRQLGQDRVLVEDVVELHLEPRQLGLCQAEAGEVGDVLDIRTRQGGHGEMIPAMRVYFARHGESEANIRRVIANRGWAYPLTERGRRQAARLADLVRADLDEGAHVRIVSSPLRRAAETAGILHAALGGATVELADALREADCGVMEGRSDDAAWAAHDDVQERWLARSAPIEGGESLDDLLERFIPWLRSTVDLAGPTKSS